MLEAVAGKLYKRRQLNLSECCIDAKFVPAKKGGACVGKTKCGKGTKLVAITEKRGRPVGVLIVSASRHEVRLVEPTLDTCFVSEVPAVLIGDKAYDSDPLDMSLRYIQYLEPSLFLCSTGITFSLFR